MGLLVDKLPANVYIDVGWTENGNRYNQVLCKEDAYRLKDAAKLNASIVVWWFQRV